MLRFALDEVNRPAPNDPAAVFRTLGIAPPMWAILNDAPTPDEHAQYRSLLAKTSGATHAAASAGPQTCKNHYTNGLEQALCGIFGDGQWVDCVRACLYDHVPKQWIEHIDHRSDDYLKWVIAHTGCWKTCWLEGDSG